MNCRTLPEYRWERPLIVGEIFPYAVDFTAELARVWAHRDWPQDAVIRAGGLDYRAQIGGRSGAFEPRWSKTVGQTVVDGTVTWVAQDPSTASLETTIASVEWDVPSGISADAEILSGQSAQANLSCDAGEQEYTIAVKAICANGWIIIVPCILQVTA